MLPERPSPDQTRRLPSRWQEEPTRIVRQEAVPLVEQIRNETYSWGLGTIGPEACRKALRHAEVEVLILAEELAFPIRIELIHLAEQAGSRIVVVRESASLAELGGAACLLQYREQDPQFRKFEAV